MATPTCPGFGRAAVIALPVDEDKSLSLAAVVAENGGESLLVYCHRRYDSRLDPHISRVLTLGDTSIFRGAPLCAVRKSLPC